MPKFAFVSSLLLITFIVASCNDSYAPKPRGYFRIDLPAKNYVKLEGDFPYSFEYPAYATITPDYKSPDEKYWINIEFPQFSGSVHLSYKAVNNDLSTYIEDARTLVLKHMPKANAIRDSLIYRPEEKTFGLYYEIDGKGAASPCQFFVTDSTSHFLRGALYFNIRPNNDSLAPVIDFIKQDIRHLINTIEWR